MSNNGKHPKSLKKILGETFTFSTVIIRPSSTDRFRYLMQFSASSILDMVMNPNPRDSLVNGSATRWTSSTVPSAEKCFSSSLLVILGDKPVTYKLFPGFSTSLEGLLERLLDLDRDLETDRLYDGEREYLDLREYDICNQTRQEKLNSTGVYNRKAQDSTKAKMITVLLGMNIVMNRTQATINWVFIKLLINCKFGVEKS